MNTPGNNIKMENDNTTWNLFLKLQNDQLSIAYLGDFSDSNTDFLINLNEKNLNDNLELKKMKKKVSFLIAESFQNIVRHNEELTNESAKDLMKSSFFSTRTQSNAVSIVSANVINSNVEEKLRLMIENLNKMNADELKALYLDLLNNTSHSAKGGAGLGLIEMARKSGQKLIFDFEKLNDRESIFYLQINLQNDPENTTEKFADKPVNLRKYLIENQVLFLYKGDFDRESVLSLLSLMENNIGSNDNTLAYKKKVFIILTELLQNISKHAYRVNESTEGILLVKIVENKFVISAGNWILTTELKNLVDFINLINNLDASSLKELYRENLKSESKDEKQGSKVGLINLLRFTENKIMYFEHKKNEALSFIEINITI